MVLLGLSEAGISFILMRMLVMTADKATPTINISKYMIQLYSVTSWQISKLRIDPMKKPILLNRMYLKSISGLLANLTSLTPISKSKKMQEIVNTLAKLKQITKKQYLPQLLLKSINCKQSENMARVAITRISKTLANTMNLSSFIPISMRGKQTNKQIMFTVNCSLSSLFQNL